MGFTGIKQSLIEWEFARAHSAHAERFDKFSKTPSFSRFIAKGVWRKAVKTTVFAIYARCRLSQQQQWCAQQRRHERLLLEYQNEQRYQRVQLEL